MPDPTFANLPTNPDVVVIGAGSAGLGAARRLLKGGKSVMVLEAANRVGGRAWTQSESFGVPVDMGASWVSGANKNPYAKIARKSGFKLIEHTHAQTDLFRMDGSRANAQDYKDYAKNAKALQKSMNRAGKKGRDVPASEVTPNDLPWMGAIQSWLGPMDYGVDFDEISTLDDWQGKSDQPSYFVREGLGSVVATRAEGLPIKLNTTVTHIDWSGTGVRIETNNGTIAAKVCVITVSTGVLATGKMRFTPDLPASKIEAAHNLPMGLLVKVPMMFDGARLGLGENNWVTYQVPNEIPTKACYFIAWPCGHDYLFGNIGGKLGWDLSREHSDVTVDFAMEELVKLVGSDARKHFIKGFRTDWANDENTLGAYAAVKPGHVGVRKTLGAPVGDRLFFAGEAMDGGYPALVSGAYTSGKRAARKICKVI
ncbi:FAD-dependent oxidoreductase [Yoonia sp. F2084L]|uniref:flavin monoamine oxidase family protein n=1 Tax=Yoonia sp. F2084L TaxID=2926419 RepID=UPI001FF54711|nr:NAD(P)/FAD-dependent oxidoreductase [Yoonia sp. F2084L]MCK0096745.1 FAD-dependent oxidoreductase [Yoonia sp. F2084L]